MTFRRIVCLTGIFVALSLGFAVAVLLVGNVKSDSPITSNAVTPEQLRNLREKASAGDASAKYALSLHVDGAEEAELLLKEAAELGYGPAVIVYVENFLIDQPNRKLSMLESSARGGFVPAIKEIVSCIERGECGTQNQLTGLKWAMTHRLLVERGDIVGDANAGSESRLASGVPIADVDRTLRQARELAQEIAQGQQDDTKRGMGARRSQ